MTGLTLEQYIEGVEKEFEFKFNHFNDNYIGHKDADKNPMAGKQICDGECLMEYDLQDVKSFLKSSVQGAWKKAEKKGFEKAIDTVVKKIDQWCAWYMALGSHNLEYNKRTPPIWEYLRKRLSKLMRDKQ